MSKPQTPTPRTGARPNVKEGLKVADGTKAANGSRALANSKTAHGSAIDSEGQFASGPGLQPQITTAVPGPKSRALFADEQSHIAPGRQRISLLAGVAFDHGEGATLTDVDGNVFVDFFAGVAVASLGHGHPALAQALAHQASRLIVGTFATPERAEAFRMLAAAAPAGLNRAHLYSGGAEAVEAALRLARSKTKRHEVLSFWGGFHGKTGGVIGLIGDESKQGYGPLPGGQYVVPYATAIDARSSWNIPRAGCTASTSRGSNSSTVRLAHWRPWWSNRCRARRAT